jgi:glutamine synthetase
MKGDFLSSWHVAGTGWDAIQAQIKKLEAKHALHIASYGEGNERRLTGKHETSSMDDFSWGVANRGASIRVGRAVPNDKCGYYEDRRPSSNLDPYVVCRQAASAAWKFVCIWQGHMLNMI